MNNRRKYQIILIILSLTLMAIMLIFNYDTGWSFWVGPLSMALVATSQIISLRHGESEQQN